MNSILVLKTQIRKLYTMDMEVYIRYRGLTIRDY